MNKRIMKLAKEAGFGVRQNKVYTSKLEHLPITEDIEKFAELIIRECADVSWRHWLQFKDCSAHFSIREHFGVEGVEE